MNNNFYGGWGNMGWVCPKCGRVYSPVTSMCSYCSGVTRIDAKTTTGVPTNDMPFTTTSSTSAKGTKSNIGDGNTLRLDFSPFVAAGVKNTPSADKKVEVKKCCDGGKCADKCGDGCKCKTKELDIADLLLDFGIENKRTGGVPNAKKEDLDDVAEFLRMLGIRI